MLLTGRILLITSLLFMFFAYSNFAPTALSSELLADYIKNHFIREMIFGLTLSSTVIIFACLPIDRKRYLRIALFGCFAVLPFWVGASFGLSTGGIEAVWGEEITERDAYLLHGPQTSLFLISLLILWLGVRKAEKAT